MSNHLDDNQYKYYVRNDELLALLLTYQDYNAVIKVYYNFIIRWT
jgi:hypothetical protein